MEAPGRGTAPGDAVPAGSERAGELLAPDLRALIRDIPDFPQAGHPLQGHHAAAGRRRRARAGGTRPGGLRAPAGRGLRAWRRRRAASCSARRWRWSSARGSCSRASRASSRTRRSARSTCWSTAPVSWSCTATRCAAGRACWSTTICSRPGGTARALCELVAQLGGEVVGCGFLIELAFLGGRERLVPHDAHALISYDS